MPKTTPISAGKSVAIMLIHSPHSRAVNSSALSYCKALLESGHKIERLFFYHESVQLGSAFTITAQDELNPAEDWQALINEYQLDAVVCIASGLKRGLIDDAEAKRYNKSSHNLSETFELAGLGDWIEAVNQSDQHIVFN